MALSDKQKAFVEYYFGQAQLNGVEAARLAGYKQPQKQAFQITQTPSVAEAISQRMAEVAMSADEVLVRLAEQARCEYAQYIDDYGNVDLAQMRLDGKMHLIKAIKQTKYGKQIEFHDGQTALLNIGRHHKLFVDRTEVTGDLNFTEQESAAERINSRIDSIAERLRAQSSAEGTGTDTDGSGSA